MLLCCCLHYKALSVAKWNAFSKYKAMNSISHCNNTHMAGDEQFLQSWMTFSYTEMEPDITVYHHPSPPIYTWPQMPGCYAALQPTAYSLHFSGPVIGNICKRSNYFSVNSLLCGYSMSNAHPVPYGVENNVTLLFWLLRCLFLKIKPGYMMCISSDFPAF